MGHGRYLDLDRPPLDVAAVTRALVAPGGPLSSLEVVEATGSTNADLAAGVRSGAAGDRAVLVTEHQQAGRGRLSRPWQTPARAALTFSIALCPSVPTHRWSWLSLLAGVAVTSVLREVGGLDAGLKWPNDVLVPAATEPGRPPGQACLKVAGILAEVVFAADGSPAVVIGIGVNVDMRDDELPVSTASSLRLAGSACTDRSVLLRAIVRELLTLDDRWRAADGDPVACGLAATARQVCVTLGRVVDVHLPGGGGLRGLAEGIDDEGRLLVHTGEGVSAVAAGDVEHVRTRS
jgi:BirA family biotin operon repressor/biotin-[acetyl-CoA-carboxylase] ligase